MVKRILSFALLVCGWLAIGVPVLASPVKSSPEEISAGESETSASATQLTLDEWVAQMETIGETVDIAEITDVQVSASEVGVTITIISTQPLLAEASQTSGNALITAIANATLNLTDAAAAEQFEPAEGIALVQVSELEGDRVQIAITGTDAPPTVEISDNAGSLVLSVTPGSVQSSDAGSEASADEDAIRLTVTAATRTEASPLDVPQSIQVIPRELIEDRGANSVVEALRTSPGIVSSFDNSLFNDAIIRGFQADFRRNGLTNNVIVSNNALPNNIERLEILRGPASVLYGQGSFGGTVNVITKEPTDEPFYSVSATAGNFERFGAGLDLSGPLNQEGDVKYRLNLAAETEGGFIEDASRQRYLVAPVIAWSPNEDTDVNFEVEYTSITAENNFGIPARGTVLPNINGELDRGRYIGGGDIEFREIDSLTIGYDLEHRFNENWRIHNAAQYSRRSSPDFSIFELALLDDERTLEKAFAEAREFETRNYLFETYAVGNFNTGSVEHELLAGIELIQVDNDSDIAVGPVNPIDLFAPETDTVTLGPATEFFISKSTDQTLGVYLQDRISFTDSLTLLLGGRVDLITSDFTDLVSDTPDSFQEEEFSPRVGLVYQPIPDLSLYTSYSRSFIPNTFGFSNDGGAFPPQRGTQFEVGAKADINDSLSLSLAYFDLSVTNVPTTDPDDVFFQVVTGEQSSRGVELFASGEILPGWNITGGYTYDDARVSADNDIPVGNRIPNNPSNAASLYTSYQLQQGDLQGLGFGLGLFYVGERAGDFDNSFELPSYVRTDASIFYEQDSFRTAINFENLFNADYFENAESDLRVRPGAPFTVKATVSWDF